MQGAAAREMGTQELHLVGEHPAPLQIDIFRMRGRERHSQQLHGRLFRAAPCLVIIAAPAGGNDVVPGIGATLDDRGDMITGEGLRMKPVPAVQTEMRIASEQGGVVERWYIMITCLCQCMIVAIGGNNRIDLDHTSETALRIDAPVYPVQQAAAGIGHLPKVIKPYRILVMQPFQWHSGSVRAQNLLRQIVHNCPRKSFAVAIYRRYAGKCK